MSKAGANSSDCNVYYVSCNSSESSGRVCYWYNCPSPTYHAGTEECVAGYNRYYYYYANTFKDKDVKTNWKSSLSDAGGYAKRIRVYSYPEKVFIKYDGNGANAVCDSWTPGTNSYAEDNSNNSNRYIEYVDGNPSCQVALKQGGTMPSGDSVYITYSEGESGPETNYKLHTNQYFRNGYDFVG